MDISEVFRLVAANGIWAVLFVFLLCYELKDSRGREKKYMDTISELTDRLGAVNEIREDVKNLSDRLYPAYECKIKKNGVSRKENGYEQVERKM